MSRPGMLVRVTVVLGLGLAASGDLHADAVPVSPGELDGSAVASGHCPTFSWTASAPGVETYELAVWELTQKGISGQPALHREVPGGALSWTPGQDDCLERGERFAWSIRPRYPHGPGAWSGPRFFDTPAGPAEDEAARALEVLGRYFEGGGTLASLLADPATPSAADVELKPHPQARSAGSAEPETQSEPPREPEDGFVPAPNEATTPVQNYGFSSKLNASNDSGSVAVEGVFDSTNSSDLVAGFLGVSVPNTSATDFVSPYLKWLSEDEIGVLGFSGNDSTDNWGVVGVGGESAWGGRFLNSDATGVVTNQVMMAGPEWAMDVRGDVRIREGSLSCPSNTYRVGAWCILGPEQSPRTFQNALKNCWSLGMQLCPLDAIMACDHLQPAGAACTTATDTDDGTYRIFLADLHPPPMFVTHDIGEFILDVIIDHHVVWTDDDAWVYAPRLSNELEVRNLLGDHAKSSPAHSFCCTMPR